MFGLSPDQLLQIRRCFQQFPQIHKVVLYGSRATGKYRTGSDIDITLIGRNLTTQNTLYPLEEALDNLLLPYTFDISIFKALKKPEFIEHILTQGKVLYLKEGGMKQGWKEKQLGEVCNVISGSGFPKKHQEQENLEFPFYKVSDMNLPLNGKFMIEENNSICSEVRAELGAKILKAGTVIFPKVGGAILTNKKRVISKDSCVDNNIMGLHSTLEIHDSYLYWWMTFIDIYDWSNKANPPSITQKTVSNSQIPAPPLAEQEAIVEVLDKAFAAIDQAKANIQQNIANAKELFQSKLNQIFSQKGEGWVEKTLGDVATFSQGVQVGLKEQLTEPSDGYIRFIRIIDYTQNTSDIRYAKDPGSKHHIKADDIVMVRYGSPGLIGRGKEGIIANNLFKITITSTDLTNDYAVRFLEQKRIRTYLGSQGSSTMPALSFGHLRTVELQYPPSKEKQVEFTSKISRAEDILKDLSEHYQTKLTSLDELKKSILQKAFNGDLT